MMLVKCVTTVLVIHVVGIAAVLGTPLPLELNCKLYSSHPHELATCIMVFL